MKACQQDMGQMYQNAAPPPPGGFWKCFPLSTALYGMLMNTSHFSVAAEAMPLP